jgi:hypothetical protein
MPFVASWKGNGLFVLNLQGKHFASLDSVCGSGRVSCGYQKTVSSLVWINMARKTKDVPFIK